MTKAMKAAKKIWKDLNDREVLGDVMVQMEEEPGLKEEILEEWSNIIAKEMGDNI